MPEHQNSSSSDGETATGPAGKDGYSPVSDPELLPEYPQFMPLEREHKVLLHQTFQAVQPEISEFTFAYQWTWRRYTRCRLTRFQGNIILLTKYQKIMSL